MKFLERGLVLLAFIGYYLAVWHQPHDYSVTFITAAGLALLYIFGMPFLLRHPVDSTWPTGWKAIPVAVFFGVISAYLSFSLTYHYLGKMRSADLLENGGILLALSAIISGRQWRTTRQTMYKNMLVRTGVLGGFIVLSLLLQQMHPVISRTPFR